MTHRQGQTFAQVNDTAGSTSVSFSTTRAQVVPSSRVHRMTPAERERLARLAPHAPRPLKLSWVGVGLWVALFTLGALVHKLPDSRPMWSVLFCVCLLAIGLRGVRPR